MKKVFLLYGICLCLFACREQSGKEQQRITILQDSIKTTSAGDVEEKDITVDPQLVEMMREALQRVDTLYKGEDLTYSYIYSDTLPISETIIKVGKFFDQQPYVVVNSTWEDRLIEVYKIEQNHTFRKKFSYISSWMEFAKDSIFDVNGDGINDLSITWSGTGALNYNPTYIYLFDPKTETFSERYEFENADFFPKEQVVRGVETGFSGVVGLYKYKWIDGQWVAQEYIYPDYISNGKYFIRTQKEGPYPSRKDGELLHKIPEEYLGLKDLSWFLMYDTDSELPFLRETLEERKMEENK